MVIPGMRWELKLNDGEWAVWNLVAKGFGNQEIEDALGYAHGSVENITNALYSKLGLAAGISHTKRVKLALMYPVKRYNVT